MSRLAFARIRQIPINASLAAEVFRVFVADVIRNFLYGDSITALAEVYGWTGKDLKAKALDYLASASLVDIAKLAVEVIATDNTGEGFSDLESFAEGLYQAFSIDIPAMRKQAKAAIVAAEKAAAKAEPATKAKKGKGKSKGDTPGVCRVCGCTKENCQQCIEKTGEPCHWANKEKTLCSACVDEPAADKE